MNWEHSLASILWWDTTNCQPFEVTRERFKEILSNLYFLNNDDAFQTTTLTEIERLKLDGWLIILINGFRVLWSLKSIQVWMSIWSNLKAETLCDNTSRISRSNGASKCGIDVLQRPVTVMSLTFTLVKKKLQNLGYVNLLSFSWLKS